MKILVTGALGHIGSRLIRLMPYDFPNSKITLIDNLMTQRYCSLFNLPKTGKYIFKNIDIAKNNIERMLDGVNIVVHLAAITDATSSFDKAKEVENNNLKATQKIAEACIHSKTKMIMLSSTSVYGNQNEYVDENCPQIKLQPQSPYAETKLKEENLITALSKKCGLEAVILRFGTIFGHSEGMRFHTAVNKFCWQAVMDEPVTVWTTAYNQKRPYLEITDACKAITHVINKNLFNGEIYNVLTLNTTVSNIIESINEIKKIKSINFVDNKIMNQLSYEVSDQKFRKTGYIPTGDLSAAIHEEIHYFKNCNGGWD